MQTSEERIFEPPIRLYEAAQKLGIHPDTLKRKAQKGEIPAAKLGKYWIFRLSVLDSWLSSQLISRPSNRTA